MNGTKIHWITALRPLRGLRLTFYSSFNFHHLWLHFTYCSNMRSSYSRYIGSSLSLAELSCDPVSTCWPNDWAIQAIISFLIISIGILKAANVKRCIRCNIVRRQQLWKLQLNFDWLDSFLFVLFVVGYWKCICKTQSYPIVSCN